MFIDEESKNHEHTKVKKRIHTDEESHEHSIIKKRVSSVDGYFAQRDQELIEKHKKEKETKAREELKNLHYMKCPKCGSDLKEIEFKQIKIDRCSECDGVWFDKGKIHTLFKKEVTLFKMFLKNFSEDEDFKKL